LSGKGRIVNRSVPQNEAVPGKEGDRDVATLLTMTSSGLIQIPDDRLSKFYRMIVASLPAPVDIIVALQPI